MRNNKNKKVKVKIAKYLTIIKIVLLLFLVVSLGYFNKEQISGETNQQTTAEVIDEFLPEKIVPEEPKIKEEIFGYSVLEKPITGYVIGTGDTTIFLLASIHGNEMGTAALLNTLVGKIKEKPELVSPSIRLVILPIANPDGYYDRVDKLNANGVNLNLNFATREWQKYGTEYWYYAGAEPFTEPESQTIRSIVEKYNPTMMISFHSYGSLVNPENEHLPSIKLAEWYAEKSGYTYFYDESWNYFGTATRWFEETYNRAAITVELIDNQNNDWWANESVLFALIAGEYSQ